MNQHRRKHRSEARVATQDEALQRLTLRAGIALAVLVSLVAGIVRAG
jgi:hypothetical protein